MGASAAESIRYLREGMHLLSAADVGTRLGLHMPAPDDIVDTERRAGRLLAVWDGGQHLYPAFQFDRFGSPRPGIVELLTVLSNGGEQGLSAETLLWMLQPDQLLEGASPAEVFVASSARGIGLARRRFAPPAAAG